MMWQSLSFGANYLRPEHESVAPLPALQLSWTESVLADLIASARVQVIPSTLMVAASAGA